MKVIIGVSKARSAVLAARRQLAASRMDKAPDFRLGFELTRPHMADQRPARAELLDTVHWVGLCRVCALTKATGRSCAYKHTALRNHLKVPKMKGWRMRALDTAGRLAIVTCMVAAPAFAQQTPTDLAELKKYAGTYAVDCSKPDALRLTVDPATLTASAGTKQLKTGAPLSAFSYFGRAQPPQGFEVALLGAAQPAGLTLLVMRDAAGPYLTVEADPPLESQFGQAALAGKFRRCP
jgi:hypothetical protein